MVENRTAFVTGGSSGIGKSVCDLLVKNGANVVSMDFEPPATTEAAADGAPAVRHIAGDVRSEQDCKRAVEFAESTFGGLHYVFANAGIVRRGSAETQTLDDWSLQIDTILTGTFLTCKAAIPALRRSGGGSIVLSGSNCAHIGCIDRIAYTAAKSAMPVLAKQLSNDYFHSAGIRTNCVSPGYVRSGMTEQIWRDQSDMPQGSSVPESVSSTWQTPESIADVVYFLLSDASSEVTGVTIPASRTALLRVASPRLA